MHDVVIYDVATRGQVTVTDTGRHGASSKQIIACLWVGRIDANLMIYTNHQLMQSTNWLMPVGNA